MKRAAGLAVLAVAAPALFLCATNAGAHVLGAFILSGYRGTGPATIRRIDGTLARGATLFDIDVRQPAGQPPGAEFHAARMDVPPLWQMISAAGWQFAMYEVRLHGARVAENIAVTRIGGRLSGARLLDDVQLRGVPGLPAGSLVDIQQVDAIRPIRLDRIREIRNARVRMPYSEPVVFSATQRAGRWTARAYCKELSVKELLDTAGVFRPRVALSGVISEVNLTATGTPAAFELTGQFVVERFTRGEVSLARAPGTLRVSLRRSPEAMAQLTGTAALSGGTVEAKRTTVALRRAAVQFAGDPRAPAFDVTGSSTVEGVPINITLTGTKEAPNLRVTSNPPMPQDVLLLMLATGKRWEPPPGVWADEQVSSELATDFIDYVLFGGLGNRIGRRFGITDLAITHGTETNWVGVETTFGNRVTLGLQVDPTPTQTGPVPADGQQRLLPSRVGAEVKLTETTAVNITGERTPLQRPASAVTDATQTGPETEDSVFLKLKKRF